MAEDTIPSHSEIPRKTEQLLCFLDSFRSAESMRPRRSQSSRASCCIFRAMSSIQKALSCFSEVCIALKCHPFSISTRSLISLVYFPFMTSLAHCSDAFADPEWWRDASSVSVECFTKSLVQWWFFKCFSHSRERTKFEAVILWVPRQSMINSREVQGARDEDIEWKAALIM